MQTASGSIEIAQINATGLSDVPTDKDSIGFEPYTRAIAWFLSNEQTKPPLTMSVEGPWGSGKSSFMLQLQRQLEELNTEKQNYFIRFNAWRSDKDEALWAAFALTFIKQLESKIPIKKRALANTEMLCRRFDWKRGWFKLTQIVVVLAVFVFLINFSLVHFHATGLVKLDDVLVIGAPWIWLVVAYAGYDKAKKIFGNPLFYDLSKYIRDLKYEEKVAFIERFQDDLGKIVKSYVGGSGRIFIFIDDLDRCEIPRAAELLQAINLLLAADQGNLLFVLGLDREMVAAGIAAKNEKILPYLAAGRAAVESESEDYHRVGVEYAFSFMEKFVQVPFRIPRPDQREIARWVKDLTDSDQQEEPGAISPTNQQRSIKLHWGADPEQFDEVVKRLVAHFGFNPRRIKQFMNVLRLRVMIALSTGVLVPAPRDA